MAPSKFFKNGTCRHCGETGPFVYEDTHLCEDCDNNSVSCAICRDQVMPSKPCNHLYWSEIDEMLSGAGIIDDGGGVPYESLCQVLNVVGSDLAAQLASLLEEQGCYPYIGFTNGAWLKTWRPEYMSRYLDVSPSVDKLFNKKNALKDSLKAHHDELVRWFSTIDPKVGKGVRRSAEQKQYALEEIMEAKRQTRQAILGWIVGNVLFQVREPLFNSPDISDRDKDLIFPIGSAYDLILALRQPKVQGIMMPIVHKIYGGTACLSVVENMVADPSIVRGLPIFESSYFEAKHGTR